MEQIAYFSCRQAEVIVIVYLTRPHQGAVRPTPQPNERSSINCWPAIEAPAQEEVSAGFRVEHDRRQMKPGSGQIGNGRQMTPQQAGRRRPAGQSVRR